MTAPHQTPAGWYADPEMVDTQRYWDGTQWSNQVRPMVDAPAVDASFAPTPWLPPAPVFVRKNTSAGKWGAAAILGMMALFVVVPVLGLMFLVVGFSSSALESADDAGLLATDEAMIEARIETRAEFKFDEDAQVYFVSPNGSGEDAWGVSIGTPVDVTASVADNKPADPPPADRGYVAFDYEVILLDSLIPPDAAFDIVLMGGATNEEYWNAELAEPCGQAAGEFVQQLPIEPGTTMNGRICIQVQAEDIGHPDTRVELVTSTGRAVFRN